LHLGCLPDDSWAVLDHAGRFDVSSPKEQVAGLHWVVGNVTYPIAHFADRYHEPGLLAKHLGSHSQPLREVVGK